MVLQLVLHFIMLSLHSIKIVVESSRYANIATSIETGKNIAIKVKKWIPLIVYFIRIKIETHDKQMLLKLYTTDKHNEHQLS